MFPGTKIIEGVTDWEARGLMLSFVVAYNNVCVGVDQANLLSFSLVKILAWLLGAIENELFNIGRKVR